MSGKESTFVRASEIHLRLTICAIAFQNFSLLRLLASVIVRRSVALLSFFVKITLSHLLLDGDADFLVLGNIAMKVARLQLVDNQQRLVV